MIAELNDEELSDPGLAITPKPVRRLRSNACPIIMPLENAPTIALVAQLSVEKLTRRAEYLSGNLDLRQRLTGAFQASREEPAAVAAP